MKIRAELLFYKKGGRFQHTDTWLIIKIFTCCINYSRDRMPLYKQMQMQLLVLRIVIIDLSTHVCTHFLKKKKKSFLNHQTLALNFLCWCSNTQLVHSSS